MTTRRNFIRSTAAATAGVAALRMTGSQNALASMKPSRNNEFWPQGARLVISISSQFESGGQPAFGVESPFSGNPLPDGIPDLPARTWFAYGYNEGFPRLMDLWDKHGIKATSHMVGDAVVKNPQLAKEWVERGHEAAAHGMAWDDQFDMTRDEELNFVRAGVEAVKNATGETPVGYNCNWLRRSVNTLSVLQELGFTYHIDDLSRDEPFTVPVNEKPFCIVPYTLRCNDIALIEGRHFSSQQFGGQIKDEFDQLYTEAATRRRMMSISTHDRIGGTPAIIKVLDDFLKYAKGHKGVVFMRKKEIAEFAMNSDLTIHEEQQQ
ncbi:polysaccharide deacetylase family protein [Mariniblastus sp.]|nr:polysaccharide deacetylase family protein [Mariniblastus sp.]